MNLSTLPVLLAVVALAFAAPENYGKQGHQKNKAKPVIMTTTLASDVPLEFDCSDKEDRGYVIGCNQDYFLCWKGAMTKASCPDGMMFNQDNGQCDFNYNIFECSGVRTSTLAEETTTLKPVDFDCSKLTDGDYAFSQDCQVNYVSCVGGLGVERTCPDQLQFDPLHRLCERIENIESCGGSPTTALPEMGIDFNCPSPSGSFGIASQLCSAIYYVCNDNVASIAMCDNEMIWDDKKKVCALAKDIPDCSFDCSGKADAAYSEGCSQYYWWCWQERAIKQACPDGMMFDGEHGLCDFEHNIFECTGVRTTTPIADVPSTMKPVDFDCTGLEDGNHAFKHGEKCQSKFVSCVGGLAWEMTCPDGLLFDPDQLLCERIEAIVACGGTAEPITTTTLSYGGYQSTTPIPVPRRTHKTTLPADVPKDNYGYGYQTTTPLADVTVTHRRKHHKTTTKAPITTTTIVADVPQDNDYGNYETTTLAEPITTTRRSYGQRKTTTLADLPTTKSYGYNVRKTTTLADIPETTTKAYGGYGQRKLKTTTLADIPTTKAYHVRKTTTLADIPTTKAYGYNRKTTTLADEPILTSTLGYNGDDYGEKILLGEPTTRLHKTTTVAADLPEEDGYGALEMTTRRRMHKTTTTVAADIPKEDSYGSYETTTLAEPITTTRRSYGQRKTTTLADLPTTKSYGYNVRKTTTLADIPTTKSYGGYNVRKTTTLADIPTTKSYGGYNIRKTTTLADIPELTTKAYGGYNVRKTTTLADIPEMTTKSYGGYNVRKTTTLADIPEMTTKSYGYGQRKLTTTTIADIPTTKAYGGYQTTLEDEPIMTTRRRMHHKTTTTTIAADVPEDDGYGNFETTTLAEPITTTRRSYGQRKTTTLADIPTTKSYGGYNVRKTTTLADIPEMTTKSYGGYNVRRTTTIADVPETTTRQRSVYSKVKPIVADQPKTGY